MRRAQFFGALNCNGSTPNPLCMHSPVWLQKKVKAEREARVVREFAELLDEAVSPAHNR